jgi:KDEL-tailed cysteine endopeptidase
MLSLAVSSFSALLSGERDLTMYNFEAYVREFGKSYATVEEHASREAIFVANLARVIKHNAQPDKTWYMTVNQFADMTTDEFKKVRRGGSNSRQAVLRQLLLVGRHLMPHRC